MALKQIRIGDNINVFQYDDGDHSEAADFDGQPIKIGQSVAPTDAVRQDEFVSPPAQQVSSDAVIADHTVVRGDGGARKVQGSGVIIDDANNMILPGTLTIQTIKLGATQVAAGAAAGELWKTNGHASLPDNVVMIGV